MLVANAIPEGLEINLVAYFINDEGVEITITLGAIDKMPNLTADLGANDLLDSVKADLGKGWRYMTREEIADYKRREDEGDANDR